MFICPWCGTNYLTFRSNCDKCGGQLQADAQKLTSPVSSGNLPDLPPAPRTVSSSYVWKLLSNDGWAITALIFGILGLIFSLVGAGLTIGIVTAFVGLPFLLLGLLFLGLGAGLSVWRYHEAQQVVRVIREGEVTSGQISELQENYSVEVNGRHPWVIQYQFQVNGLNQQGRLTTLTQPGGHLQIGQTVSVLYLPSAPDRNSIYPHP